MRSEVVVVALLVLLAFRINLVRGGNATAMLVFGDSTVDPGNNNGFEEAPKADYPPYGMDFFGGKATGRFSDGRLATDLISESLGTSKIIPAFLDPKLQQEQLKCGVSFASASSGYDMLTASKANVISFPKQIEYLKHYKIQLGRLVGPLKAEWIIRNAIVFVSCGSNDIMANYYLYPDRAKQFTLPQYTDYLINLTSNYTKVSPCFYLETGIREGARAEFRAEGHPFKTLGKLRIELEHASMNEMYASHHGLAPVKQCHFDFSI